jgi:hypothetical protein
MLRRLGKSGSSREITPGRPRRQTRSPDGSGPWRQKTRIPRPAGERTPGAVSTTLPRPCGPLSPLSPRRRRGARRACFAAGGCADDPDEPAGGASAGAGAAGAAGASGGAGDVAAAPCTPGSPPKTRRRPPWTGSGSSVPAKPLGRHHPHRVDHQPYDLLLSLGDATVPRGTPRTPRCRWSRWWSRCTACTTATVAVPEQPLGRTPHSAMANEISFWCSAPSQSGASSRLTPSSAERAGDRGPRPAGGGHHGETGRAYAATVFEVEPSRGSRPRRARPTASGRS